MNELSIPVSITQHAACRVVYALLLTHKPSDERPFPLFRLEISLHKQYLQSPADYGEDNAVYSHMKFRNLYVGT